MPDQTDHTGRDAYIVTKAICYAIVSIDSLPQAWQEASDRDDMETILTARVPDPAMREHHMTSARAHLTGTDFPADHPSRWPGA